MACFRAAVLFLALASLPGLTSGRYSFLARIPNGDNVPHPCKPNYRWKAVGHSNQLGGGPRNRFGEDFDRLNRTWSKALCQADSDGDGKTNGQELGDPECTWSEGQLPFRTTGITHPGVCDPWGSPRCEQSNAGVSCDTGEFNCSATEAPDVINVTLRFPRTKVPAEVTSYYCQLFNLPDDKDYHLVATQPLIDNAQVMHHMLLFGCDQKPNVTDTPWSCIPMADEACTSMIGLWTVGSPGECLPDNIGFLVGRSGFKSVVLQFHWTNPYKSDKYYDSSAMVVHLSASKREQNAGTLIVTQTSLEIPPGVAEHTEVAMVKSSCSNMMFQKDFNVVMGMNHMHYLGRSMRMELFRDNRKVRDLLYDEVFSYDTPVQHVLETPALVKRGDEIKLTCVYGSSSRPNTTYFGYGTHDEMCSAYLIYYPKDALLRNILVSWKSLDHCQLYVDGRVGECNHFRFFDQPDGEVWPFVSEVMSKCNEWGSCRSECRAAVRSFRQHPCFQGDVGDLVLEKLTESRDFYRGKEFIHRAQTCPEEFLGLRFAAPPLTCPPAVGPKGSAGTPKGSAGIPKGGVLGPLLVHLVVMAVLL